MTHAHCPHEMALQDLLDGRLPADERAATEGHLAECPECRARYDVLAAARSALALLREESVPADVDAAILAALRAEPLPTQQLRPEPASTPTPTPAGSSPRVGTAPARGAMPPWAWGLAAAAVLAVVAWLAWPRPSTLLPALVAQDYRAYRDGGLALDIRSTAVSDVEAFFERSPLGFTTRVFDLGMMQYTVQGGRVHRLDGRASALFVYRGPDGQPIVCQMYPGVAADLPPPAMTRSHDGIDFQIYQVEGVTVVFWQEGSVMCVLAGEGPAEAIIELAFAKAMKV